MDKVETETDVRFPEGFSNGDVGDYMSLISFLKYLILTNTTIDSKLQFNEVHKLICDYIEKKNTEEYKAFKKDEK